MSSQTTDFARFTGRPTRAQYMVRRAMVLIVIVGGLLIVGFRLGVLYERSQLPNCQEDEYLYPVDYRGPGHNFPGEYRCVHVDNI